MAARITANDLRADVSFLASDAMRGRATPSPEQDIAAEYIAAEFRRAGLEPVGDDGYFQTAAYQTLKANPGALKLTLTIGGQAMKVDAAAIDVQRPAATQMENAPAVRVSGAALDMLMPGQTRGKALLVEGQLIPSAAAPAALTIVVPPAGPRGGAQIFLQEASSPTPANSVLVVWDEAVRKALAAAPAAEVKVTARIPAPKPAPSKLRNVAGLLRGSDPTLKDTYLIISAHYDHLGVRATGAGDRIFNGANDNASGTAAVIEMARALAALPRRPKRSILFLALFGEEVGEFGSTYYTKHPLLPLTGTIADINLEQLGRTDDTEGPRIRQFNLTGFDYTNLAETLNGAGKEFGVRAVKHDQDSDAFFGRSDNAPFAAAGVPSTTAAVTYMFPDYHAVGDEWPKLDYDNMALVTRALALAAFQLADSAEVPRWNTDNPRTAPYVKARQTK
jgi:hypothetical protein